MAQEKKMQTLNSQVRSESQITFTLSLNARHKLRSARTLNLTDSDIPAYICIDNILKYLNKFAIRSLI